MRSFPGTACQFTAYCLDVCTLYDSTLLHIDVADLLLSQDIVSIENLLVTKVRFVSEYVVYGGCRLVVYVFCLMLCCTTPNLYL